MERPGGTFGSSREASSRELISGHTQDQQHSILLLLLSSSCLADSQQSVAAEQPVADGITENAAKNGATTVDKSQNKRGAPDIPVIIGAPAQHTAYVNHATVVATPLSGHATHGASLGSVPFGYGHHTALASGTGHILQAQPQYNYASAVPQLTYAHYPQYQLYHNQHQQQHQQGTGQLTHDYHPATTLHELPQQQTAYAHQQPIYAHHPATTIHYSAIPLVSGQPNYQGQHHQHQQQQQQYPLTHTQAIHYQPAAGGQPSVPIVHQAPIATINQVHQAHQLYAAQGQLAKYPLPAHSVYGAGGGVPAVQNQIYSTAPSYGDPDTLTNLANPSVPSTPRYLPRPRPTAARPYTGDIRPIAEYEDDEEGDDGGTENDLYRDEQQPTDRPDYDRPALSFDPEEPCEKDLKTGGPGSFNRNLYNMWRAYGVARTLLQASGAGSTPPRVKSRPPAKDGSTDRIHLIHPPAESDKKLKGKYYRGKYYGYGYSRQGRRDDQHDQGNRRPKSLQTGPPPAPQSSASPSSSPSAGSPDQELGTYYQQQQQQRSAAGGSVVAGQILPTAATPAHLKQLVPVTTATTTHHHGNGISYSTFTQPGTGAAFQGQTKAQSVLQTQPVYYNTLQQPATYFRQPVAVPAQQQQHPRVQVFSTVATPTVQKTAGPLFAGTQFSHPVPPYPAYTFGHQAHQGAAGLISGAAAGPTLYHQQQHQQSAAASAGKLAYLPSPVNVGGLVAGGGRGSIYLLH
ncbi:uncharacterized protein LOC128270178 [Anopheles cruzii]|uniref:uncharacterized protein LOC128270178 n=1 Tax=Anopheles cruzii TaxID=68878 RepID=UPI0022EC9813|nr:uncharacterized protein LOC128270178 [Anopheles cruzii]